MIVHILFLSAWFPSPPDNGSKLRVLHLLRALAQTHDVSLASFAFATARPDAADDLAAQCTTLTTVACNPFAANHTGTLRTFLSLRPVSSRPLTAMRQQVQDLLAARPCDVVIASTETMAAYALQASADVCKVMEGHNAMTRWMHERYLTQTQPLQRARCWLSWQKMRWFEAHLFRRFALVTMVSAQDRAACLADLPGYRGPLAVVPNGVDCAHNRPGLAPTRPDTLVFNGSLTYHANFEAMQWFLAEVYPRIQVARPDVRLVITGSVAGVDLAALPRDASVHFTGFVDDVRAPVAEAAVAIAPIQQGGGTRLKILEAMALGTPVVATPKAAEGLAVVDGEHLLLAGTPVAFAQQVCALLDHAAQGRRLAANARQRMESHYDWAQIGRQFVELVEEAVAGRAARLGGAA